MKQYYICKPGRTQEGPYPEDMVRTCHEQGIFPADTLIWFDGAAEWMPIQRIFVATQAEPAPAVPPPFQAPPPPQEEAVYYVTHPGMQPQGPYTRTAVITGYYQGAYPPGTMIWGPDTGTWIPIENLLGSALHSCIKSVVGHFQGWGNAKSWNPITAFVSCMKRYAQFNGRASRSEYWYFQLAWFILYIPIVIAKAVLAECDAEGVAMTLGEAAGLCSFPFMVGCFSSCPAKTRTIHTATLRFLRPDEKILRSGIRCISPWPLCRDHGQTRL